MSGVKWFLIGIIIAEVLIMVSRIGKEREPITPGTAVVGIIEWGIIVTLVVLA